MIIQIIDQFLSYVILNGLLRKSCEKNIGSLICSLQSDILKKNANAHGLTNLVEIIRQSLDDGGFGSGISIDLQKMFDTVDHKILLHKLEC